MDDAQKATDKRIETIRKRLSAEYKQAEKELTKQVNEYYAQFKSADLKKRELVKQGKLSQAEYIKWRENKMLYGKTMEQKVESMAQHLLNVDKQASAIVNKEMFGVYADNYNFAKFDVEKGLKINTSFTLFDEKTVERMAEKNPKLLRERKGDDGKIIRWSRRKVNTAITQGVLQGESIDKIAKRLQNVVGMEKGFALTNARTAMTAAQNAGRLDSLLNSKTLGIKVKKQWMATLDERTRSSHQALDGEIVDIEKKFSNGLKYPGDPDGAPGEIYNCRCTMIGALDDYPRDKFERYDNIEGKPIENVTYKEWLAAKNKAKNAVKLKDAQDEVDAIKATIKAKGADKVFSGIWKQDVTYADYETKKGAIDSKRKYFNDEIEKAKNSFKNGLPDWDPQIYDAGDDIWDLFNKTDSLADLKKDVNGMKFLGKYFDNDEVDMLWGLYDMGWEKKSYKKFSKLLDDLNEFEKNGPKFAPLHDQLKAAEEKVRNIKAADLAGTAYSAERKNAALWAADTHEYYEADKYFDKLARKVHATATRVEHDGYWYYTDGSGRFNRPLAGFRGWSWDTSNYVGPGNVDIDENGFGDRIRGLTKLCEKSKYDKDFWVQSGQDVATLEGFLGVPYGTLGRMTEKELQQFVGEEKIIPQFISGAINKGGGSYTPGNMLINIYVPKGSEALYVLEDGAFRKSEHEMILQRGGTYRITKLYYGKDTTTGRRKLIVDMELHPEKGYNKFQQ